MGGRARIAAIALSFLALSLAAPAGAAQAPPRPEHVAPPEQLCKPGSEATERAVHGTRADVRAERLRLAATKVAKAQGIFAQTVAAISAVPRPPSDQVTLARWFRALGRETEALG